MPFLLGSFSTEQTEIDTHLNVVAIDLNDNYDDLSDTEDAINKMTEIYGGRTWHTSGVDLHHASKSDKMLNTYKCTCVA